MVFEKILLRLFRKPFEIFFGNLPGMFKTIPVGFFQKFLGEFSEILFCLRDSLENLPESPLGFLKKFFMDSPVYPSEILSDVSGTLLEIPFEILLELLLGFCWIPLLNPSETPPFLIPTNLKQFFKISSDFWKIPR